MEKNVLLNSLNKYLEKYPDLSINDYFDFLYSELKRYSDKLKDKNIPTWQKENIIDFLKYYQTLILDWLDNFSNRSLNQKYQNSFKDLL